MSVKGAAGFFTFGVPAESYDLPHPPLTFPIILLVRRVLLRAFALLRQHDFDFANASEDEVTAALRSTIENNLRQSGEVPGFSKRTFETVIRQGQWSNYNNTRLTKTPDLFFKLRNDEDVPRRTLSEFEGLFIEAKPVDSTHSAGTRYCDDGLIRFVRGDYAWAMQDAMMLAYTRDGRTIQSHLLPALNDILRSVSMAILKAPEASLAAGAAACPEAEAIHISCHRRNFEWLEGKGPATEITIYHLWHRSS